LHVLLPACDRSILHLDADAFFASVEQRDDPKLRGRPVAVGTGVVASCSYEARRWGVRTGMRLTEARILCRSLVVIPGDYRRYEQSARRMLAICREQTPLVEVAALDDLYLDLGSAECRTSMPHHQAGRVAGDLRLKIREEVQLNVSIGVGSNKLVAKIATKEAKQRRSRSEDRGAQAAVPRSSLLDPHSSVVTVPAGGERDYLAPWPARVLPGAGRKVGDRLERLNVQWVGEVAAVPVAVLCGLFGNQGRLLHDQAHGIDPRPVEPHRPQQSVSRRASFDPPQADRAFLRAMLDHLLERAAAWLRFQDLTARRLSLTIRYGDYESAVGHASLPRPTDSEEDLKGTARERFERLYQRRLPLRLLGVELAPLGPRETQPELFPDPEAERARRLSECKDAIRQRFGFMALQSGSSLLLAGKLEHDRENFRLRTPCLTR
jgi:DNA polymerase-4